MLAHTATSLAVYCVRTLQACLLQRLSALTFLSGCALFLLRVWVALCREEGITIHCGQEQVREFYEQLKAERRGKNRVSVVCLGARNHGWKKTKLCITM